MPDFKKMVLQEYPDAKCKLYRNKLTVFLYPWSNGFVSTNDKHARFAWLKCAKKLFKDGKNPFT